MSIAPSKIITKFGDLFSVDENTYTMGIDYRFGNNIGERFKNRHVLETNTGAGFTTMAIACQASHVTTVDINPVHQKMAIDNIAMAGLQDKVTFLLGDSLDQEVLKQTGNIDCAFLDPDWAITGPDHIYKFRNSNMLPPADILFETILNLTPNIALILPPQIDLNELDGTPEHELQSLWFGDKHELYCLYFGNLANGFGISELLL